MTRSEATKLKRLAKAYADAAYKTGHADGGSGSYTQSRQDCELAYYQAKERFYRAVNGLVEKHNATPRAVEEQMT